MQPAEAHKAFSEPIPEPVPLIETEDDIVNVLLLGSDTTNPVNAGRTDVIMVVSINKSHDTVALLSIPRDLYVYIPGWETQRINTAYGYGENIDPNRTGAELLMDTIRYHLGLDIDYYARVDFHDFKQILDAVGSIEVVVDCAIEDWQLKEPELDPSVEENWQMFVLPVGVHNMDGDLALWYVRSRRTSSDFDRGRRQQVVVRALWRRVRELGLFEQMTDIWPQVLTIVDTNIPSQEILGLIPLATNLDSSRIASYTFHPGIETTDILSPEGSNVLALNREATGALISDFINPPTNLQLSGALPTVQIINNSGNPDFGKIAADRLAWEGFQVAEVEPTARQEVSSIIDYTGQSKGGVLATLQVALNINQIGIEPDANRQYDYQVTLGWSYYPCTYDVIPPESNP